MQDNKKPREFENWRTYIWDRKEDAANTFGYHLTQLCRNKAIENLPVNMTNVDKEKAIESIDIALHNIMDLLEGFWKLESGNKYSIEYLLQVVVKDKHNLELERLAINPGLDLPIGFWKWVKEDNFI